MGEHGENRLSAAWKNNDSELWLKQWSIARICRPVNPLRLDTPLQPDNVRFVCLSDTHELMDTVLPQIPEGDVLLHCGDFTNRGDKEEISKFNDQLGQLPHPHKIVIAGNHDLGFEDDENMAQRAEHLQGCGTPQGYQLLTNCTYLCNSMVKVYGITIYGAPWHSAPGWGFYRERGDTINAEWHKIPVAPTPTAAIGPSSSAAASTSTAVENAETSPAQPAVDILMTHTPPLGYGDYDFRGEGGSKQHLGCRNLLERIEQQVKPHYSVFGHIHPGHGMYTNDRGTTFINASIVNNNYEVAHPPICFDIPLPAGSEAAQQLAKDRAKLAQNNQGHQQKQKKKQEKKWCCC